MVAGDDPRGELLCRTSAPHHPVRFRIVGLARDDWDSAAFRRHHEGKITSSALSHIPSLSVRDAVLESTEYRSVDATARHRFAEALRKEPQPVVVRLALPPSLFQPTVGTRATFRLPRGSKPVVEKPFGTDLASARDLNRLFHESFPEQDVFRLDHFPGKQTVQNILGCGSPARA